MAGEDSGLSRWGGIGVVVLAIFALGLISILDSDRFDPGLTVPLMVGGVGLLGVLVQMDANLRAESRRREHEQQMAHDQAMHAARMQTFAERKTVYEDLMAPFRNMMVALATKDEAAQAKVLDAKGMAEAKFDMLTYGSDETIRALIEFFAIGAKANTIAPENKSEREAANLVFFARLVQSIRNDLGLAEGALDEVDMLRLMLTDIDANEDWMHAAMTYTKAAEVP